MLDPLKEKEIGLQEQINSLREEIDLLKREGITRDLPIEQQDALGEIISDRLYDITWNNMFYVSSFAAESVTTSSATEDVTAKEVDTSEGKYFDPKRPARFRLNFYLGSGQSNSTVYICSPAIGTSFTTATPINSTTLSYVGVKIVRGEIYLVSHNLNQSNETLIETGKTITDDTTHTLEYIYRPGESSDIYYDNKFLGSVSNNLIDTDILVYYPYLTSIKSSSGSVNLTIENYEFLQERSIKRDK